MCCIGIKVGSACMGTGRGGQLAPGIPCQHYSVCGRFMHDKKCVITSVPWCKRGEGGGGGEEGYLAEYTYRNICTYCIYIVRVQCVSYAILSCTVTNAMYT